MTSRLPCGYVDGGPLAIARVPAPTVIRSPQAEFRLPGGVIAGQRATELRSVTPSVGSSDYRHHELSTRRSSKA